MKKLVLLLSTICLFTACDDNIDKEETVLVFKYKGSVQCAPESGIPLEDMLSELTDANISVHCSSVANDGNAVVALCGAGTGVVNVYEIATSSLIAAENLGFMNVQLLENSNIVLPCDLPI